MMGCNDTVRVRCLTLPSVRLARPGQQVMEETMVTVQPEELVNDGTRLVSYPALVSAEAGPRR